MNGRQLVDEVRAIRPGLKVLFMTGLTTEMVEAQGIQIAPEEPFILKPFTILGLARKVRGVLDGR